MFSSRHIPSAVTVGATAPKNSQASVGALLVLAVVHCVAWLPATGATEGTEVGDDAIEIEVFKLPSCTCCRPWVKYMEANGFRVRVTEVGDMEPVRQRLGVPPALRGCHTTTAAGYIFEGHVTADEVRDVLAKRPPIKGLFVAGMPKGSPGMDAPEPERYEVVALDLTGKPTVVAVHNPNAAQTAKPLGAEVAAPSPIATPSSQ